MVFLFAGVGVIHGGSATGCEGGRRGRLRRRVILIFVGYPGRPGQCAHGRASSGARAVYFVASSGRGSSLSQGWAALGSESCPRAPAFEPVTLCSHARLCRFFCFLLLLVASCCCLLLPAAALPSGGQSGGGMAGSASASRGSTRSVLRLPSRVPVRRRRFAGPRWPLASPPSPPGPWPHRGRPCPARGSPRSRRPTPAPPP